MPIQTRFCSSCGAPVTFERVPAPAHWQCHECSAITFSIAHGEWQIQVDAGIQLPLDPLLGRLEVFAGCECCGGQLCIEVFLRSKDATCEQCMLMGQALNETVEPSTNVARELRAASLSQSEIMFLAALPEPTSELP